MTLDDDGNPVGACITGISILVLLIALTLATVLVIRSCAPPNAANRQPATGN